MMVRLPAVLSQSDVESVREKLAAAQWREGKGSAHGTARSAKHNLVVPGDDPASSAAGLVILDRLSGHEGFRSASMPRTVLPFVFCKYDQGMGYGAHLDLPLMGNGAGAIRTDISVTLFLSSPDEYEGGALVFDSEHGEQHIRGEVGEALLYPADALHRVETITRGSRVVAVTWIQSLIREPSQRRILSDLAHVARLLDASTDHHQQALKVRRTQYALLRMWTD
jgi:PKHD-type hydroxylase